MINLARVWLMALVLMFAGQARAAEPPGKPVNNVDLDLARAAFQRGVDLFYEGDFEAALLEFQKANRIGPSYRILYNIAQTHYELHDYVSALKSFKQYLANGDTDIPAARKTQVEETLQKLQDRIATLVLSVNVDGARVNVDDVPIGDSPLDAPVLVNPGLRRVVASKRGMPIVSRSITVTGGDRVEIMLDLRGAAQSSSRPISVAQAAPQPFKKTSASSRAPLIAGLVATGACAVTAGIFGLLALRAQKSLDRDMDTFQVPPSQVSADRSRLRNYALITDIAIGATLVSGGLTLYLALSRPRNEVSQVSQPRSRLAVTPTLNGVALQGGW